MGISVKDLTPSELAQAADDLNTLATFLAAPDVRTPYELGDVEPNAQDPVEVLILLGNSVLHTVDVVAEAVTSNLVETILVAGGYGHSTSHLRRSVREDPRYTTLSVEGKAEAEIIRDLLVDIKGIDEKRIMLETQSTNCGENAEYAYEELRTFGMDPERIVLVQDPTMQRRTEATFRRVWAPGSKTRFINFPTFIPSVYADNGAVRFENADRAGLWSMERFISLVLGEIPRLRNDENGYGPRGRGYIVEVQIPASVNAAYKRLREVFEGLIRSPQ